MEANAVTIIVSCAIGVAGWIGGYFGAIRGMKAQLRVELEWLRRDVDDVRHRVSKLEECYS